jgi:hypothetical protein
VWKRSSVGRGNCSKEEVRAWVEARGIDVADQDQADAAGLSIATRAMLAGGWEAGHEARSQHVPVRPGDGAAAAALVPASSQLERRPLAE